MDYTAMTENELKERIIRNVDQANQLKADKKTYCKGVNDTVKELDAQNAEIIRELENRTKEAKKNAVAD